MTMLSYRSGRIPLRTATTSSLSSEETDCESGNNTFSNPDLGIFGVYAPATEALRAEISAAEQRIQSGLIDIDATCSYSSSRKFLNKHSTVSPAVAAASLVDLLSFEVARIAECISSEQKRLESSARSLLNIADAVFGRLNFQEDSSTITDKARRIREQAAEVSSRNLALCRFVETSARILCNIALEADARLGTECGALVRPQLNSSPWINGGGSVITILSDIYDTIRNVEEAVEQAAHFNQEGDAKWIAPTTFERKTHKFWIEEERISEVLHAVVPEVPLLVYGRAGRLTPKQNEGTFRSSEGGDHLWDNLVTPISSVYFDSSNMNLYYERLARNEGAKLLRARWYGRQPQGDEVIFLELKTHHEEWTNSKSMKERVAIRERDMSSFLDASQDWEHPKCEAVVLAADESLKGSARTKAANLLAQMKKLVNELKLRPCVRTKYFRAAFQSPRSNSLRFTLDRMVTVIDEKQSRGDSWSLSEDEHIPTTSLIQLPYAVFEVKLAGNDNPAFIQRLIDSGAIRDGHKFSKFLTGAAAFNDVRKLPYWAVEPAFSPIFDSKRMDCHPQAQDRSLNCEGNVTDVAQKFQEESRKRTSSECNMEYYPDAITQQINKVSASNDCEKMAKNKTSTPRVDTTKDKLGRYDSNDTKYCKTDFFAATSLRRIFFCSTCFAGAGGRRVDVSPKQPARVEPKSYFANERTFIQWITAALWLVTVSLILLEMEVDNSKTVGVVLSVVSIIIALYSLATYFRRIHLMQARKQYGYVDHIGPLVLTLTFIAGIILLLYFSHNNDNTAASSNTNDEASTSQNGASSVSDIGTKKILEADPGKCTQHSLIGISKLEYQPSDVLVDADKGLLLVPSLSWITAVPLVTNPDMSTREDFAQILADVPGADFEGLTYVGDRIYAVSEYSAASSELIAFDWDASGNSLSVVGKWWIPTPSAEGITYVPSIDTGGDLYVSGESSLDKYDVPSSSASGTTLTPKRKLNMELLLHGLEDGKIASMAFFDDLLFLLHDNDVLVRAWNLTTGSLHSEWALPNVGGGFEKQWEGLAFQRIPDGDMSRRLSTVAKNRLRRSQSTHVDSDNAPTASFLLHLALDSPPQLWTLALSPNEKAGKINMPACAAARDLKPQEQL